MDGYHFTAKGVRFFKRWFNEAFAVSHVPDVPTFEGQRGVEVEKEERKVGVTPETGDMKDIRDTKKPALGELLPKLRVEWKRGPYAEFEALLVEKHGYSREEAEKLRERWVDEGLLAYDPDGYLVWVT